MKQQWLVKEKDGEILTTSTKVAKFFNKGHKDVLKAIRNTISDIDDVDFNRRNFAPVNVKDINRLFLLTQP